jgi:hypothetical protein
VSVETTVNKTLPESEKTIRITVRSEGNNGEEVRLKIDPPSVNEISDRTQERYADQSEYYGVFWGDVMNDSVEGHEVKSRTSKTRSGNPTLDFCYLRVDYFKESDIKNIIRTLLKSLDRAVVTEANRQQTLTKKVETAQQIVCDNISSRIEDMTLE